MTFNKVSVFYLCPRCLEASARPTPCPRCGGDRVLCRPGDPDAPRRKPLVSSAGEVRSQAPLWWLQRTVRWIAEAVANSD